MDRLWIPNQVWRALIRDTLIYIRLDLIWMGNILRNFLYFTLVDWGLHTFEFYLFCKVNCVFFFFIFEVSAEVSAEELFCILYKRVD